MIWKAIGQSITGTSHIATGKDCEDAFCFKIMPLPTGEETLIAFISDGAGSARYAKIAAEKVTTTAVNIAGDWISRDILPGEDHLLQLAETLYDQLEALSVEYNEPLNEFSCTLLGCILLPQHACFMQIGDGAIVRNDGTGHYTHIWWPHNGEYQNTTAFLVDDPNFPHLHTMVVTEEIAEVALFTDGLQMLALNAESTTVHQPFFTNMLKWLQLATEEEHVAVLDKKLAAYLAGDAINSRTDDDKTLFLATRLKQDNAGIQRTT
ncbi:MAG: PP2C family serine/threonine-protein phosphatase [Chitinophagaceae bacterium]